MAACLGRGRRSCSTPRAAPAIRSRSRRRCCTWQRARWCWLPGWTKEIEGGLGRIEPHRLQRSTAAHVRSRVLGDAAAGPRHAGSRSPPAVAGRRPRGVRRRAARRLDRDADAPAQPRPVRREPCRRAASSIASTMPLGARRSRGRAKHLLAAPVLEIYGSTETGALAMRRTARETRWLPLDGVQLERADGATLARGAHFASPVKLLDELGRRARRPLHAARPTGRPDQDRRAAGFARRAQPAAAGPARSRGRRVLPAGDRQPHRAAVPDLFGRAAGPRGDAALAARAARSGVPAARPSSGSSGCRASENGKLRRQALDRAYAPSGSPRRSHCRPS